ncbi:MAG TPA: class I SAM-dependent methyltransferase [Polyangia bacterium]|nr:class I SAM-dependent methyltransferase [Polyangia bacterium]
MNCRICDGQSDVIGEKVGRFAKRPFVLRRCRRCQFSFVENPWLDYAQIYDAAYYEGRGADPLVDYGFELARPERTIRRHEWEGIVRIVGGLTALMPETRWLDFGCGNGGLVRHARKAAGCEVVGFEQGGIVAAARAAGIPILEPSALAEREGSFDVVTAIEVLEHVADPLATLRQIRRLLRPGGLFFYTTGNAAPFRDDLLSWGYFVPEIHISLYEPASMTEALRRTGFEPQQQGWLPGWDDVIRFKILKNLRLRRSRALHRAVPWRVVGRVVDRHHRLTEFPVAHAV